MDKIPAYVDWRASTATPLSGVSRLECSSSSKTPATDLHYITRESKRRVGKGVFVRLIFNGMALENSCTQRETSSTVTHTRLNSTPNIPCRLQLPSADALTDLDCGHPFGYIVYVPSLHWFQTTVRGRNFSVLCVIPCN
jgi:hypothetical protein